MRRFILIAFALVSVALAAPVRQSEPTIRIGLDQNADTVSIRSAAGFLIEQHRTRSAKFTTIVAIAADAPGRTYKKDELQRRILVEIDGGDFLLLPITTRVRISSPNPLEFDNHTYRGTIEVFVNARSTFTVVNELPMETYLQGVVPNELSPVTFGMIEALRAQAVAARTYAVRNMGQYNREGYDICDTDACQVYQGAGTEDALASRAIQDTRGMIAVYNGQPINALYSSTCGGRTESSENIFGEKVPYLVSVYCEYKHPEPQQFSSTRSISDWKDGVLAVAGVSNFTDARRFMGLQGRGEPASLDLNVLGPFIRQNFYPNVRATSDVDFVTEQGLAPLSGQLPLKETLFRLIDKKNAFEWQQGVLVSWDGQVMKLVIAGQPREFRMAPDALIYQRIGDERVGMKDASWIGGELMDFRAVNDTIQFLVFHINFASPSADRYSRLALWQVHKTRQELDTAFKPLGIGSFQDLQVVERGESARAVNSMVIGSTGRSAVRALRLRTLLGLRDSLFSFDEERNAQGQVLGITFYGQGWGHGVGMCQVGAYGMALDGATYDQILKKYYTGIDLKKMY